VCGREREREKEQGNVEGKERKNWQHIWWGGRLYKGRLSLLPPFIIMLVEVVGGVSRGYAIVERIDPTLHTMPSHIIYLSVHLSMYYNYLYTAYISSNSPR
jgi:hypothetical protein